MSLISGNESKIFAKGVIGNVRKAQEDSHGWKLGTPNGDLFVVCDGMGGHVGGAMASKIAVESIIEHICKEHYASPVEALDGALQFANMQILGYTIDHPELKGMGTTACIVMIQGDNVWIAHVGDSRIYLYLGNERQLHRITKDHSYVQTLVDAGEITDDEAEHHPNKNRIMKALGIKPELHPSFNYENKAIHPKNGDVFLICSDGLSGMIPDSTIGRTMGESMDLHHKGERLIELAMIGETVQPGGQDNCTLEMIEVDNSPWVKSEFNSFNPRHKVQSAPANTPLTLARPEAQKPIKPQPPQTKGHSMVFVAIAVATLIVVTFLAIFLPPVVRGYKIEKAQKEMVVLKKAVDVKKIEKAKAEEEYNEAKTRFAQYSNANNETRERHEKALDDAKKINKKKQEDYNNAVNAYNKAVKEYNEKYAKSISDKNQSEIKPGIIEDWDDFE